MGLPTSLIILYCLGVIICFVTFLFMDALTNKRIDIAQERLSNHFKLMSELVDTADRHSKKVIEMQKELDALSAQVNEMQMERK